LHELSWSDNEKPIRVLAVDKRVSDVFRVGNVDVDVVADLGLELFELGAGDVDSPGVT
jgi:hypothetical protein